MKCTVASISCPARTAQTGFSLLEVAVALVVAGLLSWATFSGYETVSAQQERERAQAVGQQLQSMLRAFSMRHGRLPCPDTNATANGYESMTSGACTAGNQLGWFPYISLGLDIPPPLHRARYAVFRSAHVDPLQDADLAVIKERTDDSPSEPDYLDVTDLVVGLNNASKLSLSTSHPYLTGDGGPSGAIDCGANPVMAAAYWLVIPLQDKDADNNRLDTPQTTSGLCAANPAAPLRVHSDDIVLAESPAQLAGWLRKSMP